MADFYTLPEAEKAVCFRALVEQALPLWGYQGVKFELINQRKNAVFAVQAADGTRFAMRVHRVGYRSDQELLAELQWVADILVGATGRYGNVIKLRPPLAFSCANADQLLSVLGRLLAMQVAAC